jgi:hypothetical protein
MVALNYQTPGKLPSDFFCSKKSSSTVGPWICDSIQLCHALENCALSSL